MDARLVNYIQFVWNDKPVSDPIPTFNAQLRFIKEMNILLNGLQDHLLKLKAEVDRALVAPMWQAQKRPVKVRGANGAM
jgi:hypothetical protein